MVLAILRATIGHSGEPTYAAQASSLKPHATSFVDPNAKLRLALGLGLALAQVGLGPVAAQVPPPPQVRHSTYDFTEGSLAGDLNLGLKEVWVDTKSPGDGFTYSVGTVEVLRTIGGAPTPVLYSGVAITPVPPLIGVGGMPPGFEKSVVVLQCVDANQQIVWQRFFYGFQENSPRPINVRGISVWPGATPADTRIAIFGESRNDWLPEDQFDQAVPPQQGFPGAFWRGFIAVFDGGPLAPSGPRLRWSHQFYGRLQSLSLAGDMAITDASVRVEGGLEVVTYCGFSNCGLAGLLFGSTTPLLPFGSPTPTSGCSDVPADGNTDNDRGNYDGFVGRIAKPVANPAATVTSVFHSVVGGRATDALFGLAEADANRFCVVGVTGELNFMNGSQQFVFPFTDQTCLPAPGSNYSFGVVLQFDARNTAAGGALILDWSQRLGDGASQPATFTVARDVAIQRGWGTSDLVVVVGSTDDASLGTTLSTSVPGPLSGFGPQTVFGGGTDGFVVTCLSQPLVPIGIYQHATLRGGPGEDGLTGVQSWNEFRDHFAVLGFANAQPGGADFEVGSYWTDTSPLGQGLVVARTVVSGATGSYRPTAMGVLNAGFVEYQGGGITVDNTGRVTAVGALVGTGLRYDATAVAPPLAAGRPNVFPEEAYRVVLDLLPNSCGRTDGTGTATGVGNPQYPLPGFFGGSTPQCALSPFGNLVGVPPPANPVLPRMYIDYIGNDPADNEPLTIVVDRPPGLGHLSAWQLGFPGAAAPGPVALSGTILWTTNTPAVYQLFTAQGSAAQQWILPDLPLGQTERVTVQVFSLLGPGQLVPGGNLGPTCVGLSDFAASPAIWFSYTGQ